MWVQHQLGPNEYFFGIFTMNDGEAKPELEATSDESQSLPSFPKIIKFDSLARCGDEIWIENNGQIYRLQRTKQGKLLLTK